MLCGWKGKKDRHGSFHLRIIVADKTLSSLVNTWHICLLEMIQNTTNVLFTFWATVCKTVRLMLSDRCPVWLSCLVCNVGVLWPNGCMHQDETWHVGRPMPRPWSHCVRWGPSSRSPKGHSPQFSARICCGQMAKWIKMPLGTWR